MNENLTVLISVDIGLNGGVAFFDVQSRGVLSLYSMPTFQTVTSSGRKKGNLDLERLKFILEIPKEHHEHACVVMENVHAFPGQGVVAIATLLEQKGIIRGMAKGLGYNEKLIEPKTWQRFFHLIPPKNLGEDKARKTKATLRKKWLKEMSLQYARECYPEWSDTKLADKSSHGLSDALLLGRYFLTSRSYLQVE